MRIYPRHVEARLRAALKDTPVVMLGGPRQSGKTTLAQHVARKNLTYLTLDDATVRQAASTDPVGFVRRLDRAVIDEVQRAPDLLPAIKQSVDADRRPGRFLLTGSANILTIPRVTESLAGRMEIVSLYPLSRAEIIGPRPSFLADVFLGHIPKPAEPLMGDALVSVVLSGGFPEALARPSEVRRSDWLRAYVDVIVQRDVRDIASVEKLNEMPRLLQVLGEHSGKLLNLSEIGGQIGFDHKTVQRYVGIFEQVFLIVRLEPWFTNRLKRLIKSPKLHFVDSGLLAAARGLAQSRIALEKEALGPLFETFVVTELLKQTSWMDDRPRIYHFRDREQMEVDVVLENLAGDIVGLEVKASATVTASDFRGLRRLLETHGKRFRSGIVFYDGGTIVSFGDRLTAAPFPCLWS